jgi:hypothetical protein
MTGHVRLVYGALAAFVVGFVLFPPRVFMVVDEERYVSQAVAFSEGALTVRGAEILHSPTSTRLISDFPPGTSLLQTPLVWLGGWRLAAALSVLGLIVATLLTLKWLRESGMQPGFALLIPGFFGALFFGRIGMSDVPSAAIVAGAAYLCWRTPRAGRGTAFLAGLIAGSSLLFREPLALLLAPLVAAAARRGRGALLPLTAGGLVGVTARLVLSRSLFGSATYVRDSGYGFSFGALEHTLPVYAIILLLMFPGAALLPVFYRGPNRAETIAAVASYLGVFLFYEYDSVRENGPVKGLILASRYMVPALPLLAFMAADVWPRWSSKLDERHRPIVGRPVSVAAFGAIAMAFVVHPLARQQEAVPLAITRGLYLHTSADIPVITNTNATLKYLSPSYGPRKLILRQETSVDSAAAFARRLGRVSIALLDRNDSEMFRQESAENTRFMEGVQNRCELHRLYDERVSQWAHLRVFELRRCR